MPPFDPSIPRSGAFPPAGVTGAARDALTARAGQSSTAAQKKAAGAAESTGFWGDDGFTFGDLVDLVNPLQHIPVVASIYRGLTGDEIAPGPRLIGDGLFSITPLGAAASMAVAAIDLALQEETGRSMGERFASAIGLGDDGSNDGGGGGAEPTAYAEIEGLPWLKDQPQRAVLASNEATVPTPDKPEPAPPPTAATPAAQPVDASAAPIATQSAAPAADVPGMSTDQWAILLAGLEVGSGPAEEPKAPPQTPVPAPAPAAARATDILPIASVPAAPAPIPRDAVAAAMTDALDKYATLQRMRTERGVEIDQKL